VNSHKQDKATIKDFKEYYKKMRTFRLIVAASVFAALFAVSAFAQVTPTAPKIGLVDIYAFGAEKGITKYINAMGVLEKEAAPMRTDLQGMVTKIQNLEKEITGLRDQASKPNSPISATTVNNKIQELEDLKREAKFKQDNANAKFQSRYDVVVGPIWADIRKAMQEFAKQKGFDVIFDGAKLEEAGILLGFSDKVNITTEFIQFYNTRPAGTAAATTAK
jgi:Skp family chaperone for outer membrane proteins